MPERRAASHHRDRVAEALKDEIGSLLEGELGDKRIGLCYITEVVMNPGGNFNEAFKATILVVDPDTGELVPQFRQENSGYDLPAAPDRQPPVDDTGTAIRRETFRGR